MMDGKLLSALDDTDHRLIALLRDNARTPTVGLARKLRLARATVQNRMARLEKAGVIAGYTIRLRPEAEKQRIRAIMSIEVVGHHGAAVLRALRGNPSVTALHTTNGQWDLIAEVHTDTLENFDRVLNSIRAIEGIANSETSLLLTTYKL